MNKSKLISKYFTRTTPFLGSALILYTMVASNQDPNIQIDLKTSMNDPGNLDRITRTSRDFFHQSSWLQSIQKRATLKAGSWSLTRCRRKRHRSTGLYFARPELRRPGLADRANIWQTWPTSPASAKSKIYNLKLGWYPGQVLVRGKRNADLHVRVARRQVWRTSEPLTINYSIF